MFPCRLWVVGQPRPRPPVALTSGQCWTVVTLLSSVNTRQQGITGSQPAPRGGESRRRPLHVQQIAIAVSASHMCTHTFEPLLPSAASMYIASEAASLKAGGCFFEFVMTEESSEPP